MTTKQRAALRSMCNTMEPVLHIGKEGINDNLVKQCWDALEARELIKVTVQRNAPFESTREACGALCGKEKDECLAILLLCTRLDQDRSSLDIFQAVKEELYSHFVCRVSEIFKELNTVADAHIIFERFHPEPFRDVFYQILIDRIGNLMYLLVHQNSAVESFIRNTLVAQCFGVVS